MSGNSTPETERNQILFQQRVQDELNKVTAQQIQELTSYIKALEARLNDKINVPMVSNKAAFSLLAKPTPWNGDPDTWVDFEVDINSYLELSENKTDLYRITWTLGYLSGDAKKFGKNFKATNPLCSFYEFIEALKANFNVNSASELALQKLQKLKYKQGSNIMLHLAKFNELRLNARIQNPNLALNYLLDSLQVVYGQEIAKVAVFQPAIKTDYAVLNKWLLSIYDSDMKLKAEIDSGVVPMDVSRVAEFSVSQITRKPNASLGWKRMPLEDHVLFQAFAKKIKLCTRCRDIGYGPTHRCRAQGEPFVRIPIEIYPKFCSMMETCGLCLKCRDLAAECACNTDSKAYSVLKDHSHSTCEDSENAVKGDSYSTYNLPTTSPEVISSLSFCKTYVVRSLSADSSSKYLNLSLGMRQFSILCDSGSQPPLLINAKLIDNLNLKSISIPSINLRAFDGTLVESIAKSTLPLLFSLLDDAGNTRVFSETFLISHNMTVDFILGLPFCKKYGFFWDFGKDQIVIPPIVSNLPVSRCSKLVEFHTNAIQSSTENVDRDSPLRKIVQSIPGIKELGDLHELESVFDITRIHELPELSEWALKINLLPDAKLNKSRPYKHSAEEEASLSEELNNGMKSGRIVRSLANVSSPVLFVKAPGKPPRMCIDYRLLNSQTVSEPAVLPNIQDLLDKLPPNFQYLSKIDLKGAFHQLRMDPDSEDFTTFVCSMGTFKYRVMPFGLKNAPGHFQRFMNSILLYKVTDDGHYIDDIIFVDACKETHVSKIRQTLKILLENGLIVSPEKCIFFAAQIEFLGHQLTVGGKITPLESRIGPILNYPVPKNVKQIQAFLGFCNYYRRFLKDFSHHAVHLSNLTRKDTSFQWTEVENNAFQFIKNSFKNCLLYIPDRSRQFVVETDASDYAIGAALHQDGKPLAFFSRKFTASEINYPIYDKELLAILSALQHWRHLLVSTSQPIIIHSDHKNLTYFKKPQHLNRRQARWQQELTQFNFQIVYKRGTDNIAADILSRDPSLATNSGDLQREINDQTLLPDTFFLNYVGSHDYDEGLLYHEDDSPVLDIMLTCDDYESNDIVNTNIELAVNSVESEQQEDSLPTELDDVRNLVNLQDLRSSFEGLEEADVLEDPTKTTFRSWPIHVHMLLAGVPLPESLPASFKKAILKQKSKFSLKNGVLLRKISINQQDLYVPYVPIHLRRELMLQLHNALGHLKNSSILDGLRLQGWWPSMENDFKQIHSQCEACQAFEPRGKGSVHPIHPLPVPFLPFHTWHMDWIQDLPESSTGKCNILVAIDSATRFMIAKAYPRRDTAAQLEFMNVLMIERGFGAPKVIISDRAKTFVESIEWKKFCKINGIETRFSTSYHPQTNGRVERLNSLIGQMLSKLCAGDSSRWDSFLNCVCFNLNIRKHTVTGYSPFYLAFGFTPKLPGNLIPPALYDFQKEIDRETYQARELELLGHARAAAFHRSMAQARKMQNTHDSTHKTITQEFKVGDKVKRIRQRLPGMMISKLAPKWEGPFVIGSIGPHDSYYIHKNGIYEHHPVNANHLMLWKERGGEDTVVDTVEDSCVRAANY